MSEILSSRAQKQKLDRLRRDFQNSDCSDPRDRVYGVLSLQERESDMGIIPDYSKMTIEVFKDAVRKFMGVYKRCLNILQECEMTENRAGPSWVPD
jgi:hypothetical protein